MEAVQRQVMYCLKIYRQRGEEALALLLKGDVDQALECLKWRRAAYYNFCFYDQRAVQFEAGYLGKGDFQDIWTDLRELDRMLVAAINERGEYLVQQLQRVRLHRQSIRRYHSGSSQNSGFKKSV